MRDMEQFVRKRIIGIAFGEQEISVCAHFQDQIAEVLRLPAVFTVSPVGEVPVSYTHLTLPTNSRV